MYTCEYVTYDHTCVSARICVRACACTCFSYSLAYKSPRPNLLFSVSTSSCSFFLQSIVHVTMYTCVCGYISLGYTYTYTYIYACYENMCIRIYVYICMCTNSHYCHTIAQYIHIHIHIHIHTHICSHLFFVAGALRITSSHRSSAHRFLIIASKLSYACVCVCIHTLNKLTRAPQTYMSTSKHTCASQNIHVHLNYTRARTFPSFLV
jgi:hypothetical protein